MFKRAFTLEGESARQADALCACKVVNRRDVYYVMPVLFSTKGWIFGR